MVFLQSLGSVVNGHMERLQSSQRVATRQQMPCVSKARFRKHNLYAILLRRQTKHSLQKISCAVKATKASLCLCHVVVDVPIVALFPVGLAQ